MAPRSRMRPHLPIIAPDDFRKVAIEYLAEGLSAPEAERRYAASIAAAPAVMAAALAQLRAHHPGVPLDFTAESVAKLDLALADRPKPGVALPLLVSGVGAYLGETLRIVLRGHWVVRFDPTTAQGLWASTIHLDPGVAGHAGYECEVFDVAARVVRTRGKELTLGQHLAFARDLMQRRRPEPERWNGLGCRPTLIR